MQKFKSLEDTFVYRHLNGSNGLSNSIMGTLKEGRTLDSKDVEEAFMTINKNFKYPLKYDVMKEFETKGLVLLYAPEKIRIPTCLPFFLTKNNNGVVSVVNVDIYGKMNKETGSVNIDAKKLYCMMEGAYFARKYFRHHQELSKRNVIITDGSSIYANMFTRVLNKRYALNIDRSKMHKVIFLASKFYMINILQMKDSETVTNYALKNCVNGNPFILKEVDSLLTEEDYKDLSSFVRALTKEELGLGMGDLTVRGYLEQYINMYDASALMALEHFAYFMYTVLSALNGAFINNQYILDDIIEKHGAKLYNDMMSVGK